MTEPLDRVLATRAAEGLDTAHRDVVVAAVEEMVAHPEYPCLGARSVFRRDAVTSVVLDDLTDGSAGGSLDRLGDALRSYVDDVDTEGDLVSFLACFRGPEVMTEREFEQALWGALQHLHDRDDRPWAEGVAADPGNPHFAFSLGGTPFFVVGLHPGASRVARRAPVPTLVFNLHEQFERLRADGRFDRLRDAIRRRDTELQGRPNPMAVDHGVTSEARQYSGRAVPSDWSPPFHPDPQRHDVEEEQ
ncbi:guanitoxin biosynthesis heme-dependent pre-guanitoxin N-hydroxylase GntA [Oryzobacter sp. R7]|uniref:guanitoxin biosynthesis heme-dependent pre-guanitoxin N-hydroxylase GntA n=1 Tax=Oryzobacter faecalis TaxID=3388656 RepID=UPI00398CE759